MMRAEGEMRQVLDVREEKLSMIDEGMRMVLGKV